MKLASDRLRYDAVACYDVKRGGQLHYKGGNEAQLRSNKVYFRSTRKLTKYGKAHVRLREYPSKYPSCLPRFFASLSSTTSPSRLRVPIADQTRLPLWTAIENLGKDTTSEPQGWYTHAENVLTGSPDSSDSALAA